VSDANRDRILAEALPLIQETGFSDATIAAAAARAHIGKRETMDAFPKGPASLAEAFSHWADQRMRERMRADPATRMTERVTHAVKARIEVLMPHKEAARRAAAFLALPQHAALGAKLMAESVDAMWRAAGDKASDFSYYTKRALLGGVYGATFLFWLSDASENNQATWKFLDARIGDAMRLGKFGAAARDALSKLPDPFHILSGFMGRRG
jgi:ubiquinone biosynthesis protein COQ9